MNESKKPDSSANYGIQADNVEAEVLAVGTGARATQHRGGSDSAAIDSALAELRQATTQLAAGAAQAEMLDERLRALESAATAPSPDKTEVEVALGKLAGVVESVEKSAVNTGRIFNAVSKLCTLVGASLRFFTG